MPSQIDLETVKDLFQATYQRFEVIGYFQEAFGFECVDDGYVPGKLGWDIESRLLRSLRKRDLWPIGAHIAVYSEDDLFDVIEFLHDHISKPSGGRYHGFSNCGQHYWPEESTFDNDTGKAEFRRDVNDFLKDYSGGYELSEVGEILIIPEHGLASLLQNQLPSIDTENVDARVERAIGRFRRSRASDDEKAAAVRELADVLEFLRPKLRQVLTRRDEADLFNIANNFGVRHHNTEQKTAYDRDLWLPWMFYFYLATIHVASRILKRQG